MSNRIHLQSLVFCGLLAAVAPARAAALPANCNCDRSATDHRYIVKEEAELPDIPFNYDSKRIRFPKHRAQ